MTKKILPLAIAFFLMAASTWAQTSNMPFKGHLYNAENKIHLYLDLYESSLEAPGYAFLGKLNGYMQGRIYGVWLITSHEIKGNTALLRLSNDQGSDAQAVRLVLNADSTFSYEAIGGNNIKKAVNRKLVKVPAAMIFKRQ